MKVRNLCYMFGLKNVLPVAKVIEAFQRVTAINFGINLPSRSLQSVFPIVKKTMKMTFYQRADEYFNIHPIDWLMNGPKAEEYQSKAQVF